MKTTFILPKSMQILLYRAGMKILVRYTETLSSAAITLIIEHIQDSYRRNQSKVLGLKHDLDFSAIKT
jgi:hypothetical protein